MLHYLENVLPPPPPNNKGNLNVSYFSASDVKTRLPMFVNCEKICSVFDEDDRVCRVVL